MGAERPRVVVITGASAGVGRATARAFARHGDRVALLARGREGLEGARHEIEDAGGSSVAIICDVACWEAVDEAAAQIEATLGPIDVWVNNAITTVYSPFLNMSICEFHRVTEVCYFGYVHGTLAALRRMVPRNRGVVVQVGSALAYRAIPLQSAYCGSKHAIKGFTDSVRTELMHEGSAVRMVMVQLPGLNTPQFDLGRNRLPRKPQPVPPIFQPEVAADAIVWAAEHEQREMTVGQASLKVIAAQKLAPAWADRYLARTGYNSQMTVEDDSERPHNLWEPVPGDHGARGRFDQQSHAVSVQLKMRQHRSWLALAGLAGAAVAGSTWWISSRDKRRK